MRYMRGLNELLQNATSMIGNPNFEVLFSRITKYNWVTIYEVIRAQGKDFFIWMRLICILEGTSSSGSEPDDTSTVYRSGPSFPQPGSQPDPRHLSISSCHTTCSSGNNLTCISRTFRHHRPFLNRHFLDHTQQTLERLFIPPSLLVQAAPVQIHIGGLVLEDVTPEELTLEWMNLKEMENHIWESSDKSIWKQTSAYF